MSGISRSNREAGKPVDITAQLDAGAAHYAAGRLTEAESAYGLVEAAAPNEPRAAYSLAIIDLRLGRLKQAVRRLRRVARIEPAFGDAHHNLGYAFQQLGRWSDAVAAYRKAADQNPVATSHLNLAIALAAIGRLEEAAQHYRLAAADPATRADALARLALLAPAWVTEVEADDLRRLSGAADVTDERRIALLFALGGILDRRAEIDAAFSAYAAGNELKHRLLAHTGADPSRVAEQNRQAARYLRERVGAPLIAQRQLRGASKASPIFIVGFPRSGSTLIEQVLASHGSVQGMGESPVLAEILSGQFPYVAGPVRAGHFRDLAEAYLSAQKAKGWDGRSRLVDKTLENYLHIGVVALMFPRAIILHSLREPADTGFACFRQLFVSGNETLYDLAQIGEEYRRYRQLMAHWDECLPGRMDEVEHEALVTDPARRIRWLVTEVCNLSWDPACLQFHQSTRGVTTASGAQVRQPIFRTSLGRWRAYAEHLGPLLDALGPYAPTAEAGHRPQSA